MTLSYVGKSLLICHTDCEDLELSLLNLLSNSPCLLGIKLKYINKEGLKLIASSPCCPYLCIINADIGHLSLDILKTICQACPNLLALNLRTLFSDFSNRHGNISGDVAIRTILQNCPLIQMLPESETWYLTNSAMDSLASIHTLSVLSLGNNAACSSQSVQRVLQANPNLARIGLCGPYVDDALLRRIGNCCGNLKYLNVEIECTAVTNQALEDLFRGCPLLVDVRLALSDGVMSNTTLTTLFGSCRELSVLHLSTSYYSSSPTALGAEYIFDNGYPSLTMVSLSYNAVADMALRTIFTHCHGMLDVELDDCDHVTDETIKTLARSCPLLGTLRINTCPMVTVAGVLEVASRCTHLISLDLSDIHINDQLLIQLSINCPSLNTLMLQIYDGVVTKVGIAAVADRCTQLTLFILTGNGIVRTIEQMNANTLYPHIKFVVS